MSLKIEPIFSPTLEARILISELDEELAQGYPPEQRHGYSVERVFQPGVLFFIAKLDDSPAGCGAIHLNQHFAEVKRMYVRPVARGQGIAQAILTQLADECRVNAISRMVLETGNRQLAAIKMYQRWGFTPCTAFGPYLTMPAGAVERSLFFEKHLF